MQRKITDCDNSKWSEKPIIRECHQRVLHNGVKEILAEIRTRFWIVRGIVYSKEILSLHKAQKTVKFNIISEKFKALTALDE